MGWNLVTHIEGETQAKGAWREGAEENIKPKMDKERGEWENYIMRSFKISPNTIQVIKLRRIRWAGHVAHIGERRGA